MSCILVPRRRVCSDIVCTNAICITLLRTECYYVSENEDAYCHGRGIARRRVRDNTMCVMINGSSPASPGPVRLSHCYKRLVLLQSVTMVV